MTPDRIWLGRLTPETRQLIYDAIAPLGWNLRETPCNETAASLTPKGGLGILILEGSGDDGEAAAGGLPTLWIVPHGGVIPSCHADPPQEFVLLPTTAGEIVSRLQRLARAARRAEELQRLSKRVAKEAERRRGIVGAIAHDLTNPLTATIEYLELLLDGTIGEVTSDQRSILTEARGAARRVAERIGEIVDATRAEHGVPVEVDPCGVDLGDLLTDLEHLPPLLRREKEQRLTVRTEPGLPAICGDRGRLEQVLRHLLDNAARYSPPGTQIEVTAVRDPEVTGFVRLTVADAGCGLPAGRLTGSPGGPGTSRSGGARFGVGLLLVRAITEALGGEVTLSHRFQGGTKVLLRLPAWGSRAARIAEAQARLAAPGGPPGDAWLCRACGRKQIAALGKIEPWRVLSPGELLVIGEDPPEGATRLGRVHEFRRAGTLAAKLLPRMRWSPIGRTDPVEVSWSG